MSQIQWLDRTVFAVFGATVMLAIPLWQHVYRWELPEAPNVQVTRYLPPPQWAGVSKSAKHTAFLDDCDYREWETSECRAYAAGVIQMQRYIWAAQVSKQE